MRDLPRRLMSRLAEAIMIASVAALARRYAPEGPRSASLRAVQALPLLSPGASRGIEHSGTRGASATNARLLTST